MYMLNVDGAINRRMMFDDNEVKQKTDQTSALQTEQNINHDNKEDNHNSYLQNCSVLKKQANSLGVELVDNSEYEGREEQLNDESDYSKAGLFKKNSESQRHSISQGIKNKRNLSLKPLNILRNSKIDFKVAQSQTPLKLSNGQNMYISSILNKSEDEILNLHSDQKYAYPSRKSDYEDKIMEQQQQQQQQQQSQHIKIVTFSYVYRFIREIFLKYIQRDASLLTVTQHLIINDKAVYIDKKKRDQSRNKQKKQYFKNIFDRIQFLRENKLNISNKKNRGFNKIFENIIIYMNNIMKNLICSLPIISPNNSILMVWDFLFILLYLLFLIIYPFYFSFERELYSVNILDFLQKISLIATSLDSVLGFHTGVYEFGKIVVDRQKIYERYKNRRLLTDILCIALLLFGVLARIQILCIISVFFRYQSINEKVSRITMNLQLKSKNSSSYDLIKLAFYILLLIHIFGCGFYLVGVISVENTSEKLNWIRVSKIENSPIMEQYIFSLYFVMVTMVTIGYGDIYPVNQYEKLYVIVVSFISCVLFGFSLNLIGSIVTEMQRKSNDLHQKQFQIQRYLNSRQIDFSSQIRVLKYLEFLDYSEDASILEGQKILQSCSKEIRDDILFEYFGRVLRKCRLFKELFSKDFLQALSLKMREKSFAPGEIIIERGQKLSELYIITKGDVDYYFNKQDQQKYICDVSIYQTLFNVIQCFFNTSYIPYKKYESNVIDARIFCNQQPSDLSLRSKGITIASYIDYQTFIDTIQYFQSDKEKFSQLKDQFLNDQRFQYPCGSCGLYKHILFDCPQLSYKVNKTKFLNKYAEKVFQNRDNSFKRVSIKEGFHKFNTLSLNEYVKSHLKVYRCSLAKIHYGMVYPNVNFDEIPFNHQDDKDFLQNVPKINIEWYSSKKIGEETERGNYNYQNSDATGNYYKLQQFQQETLDITSSSESDTSEQQSLSKPRSKGTIGGEQISLHNDMNSQTAIFINNDQKLSQAIPLNQQEYQSKTDIRIPSENKISILSNIISVPQIPYMEEPLSPQIQQLDQTSIEAPQSQFNALRESILFNNSENSKEQKLIQKVINKNPSEKTKTHRKRGQNNSNLQNDIRTQSRNSFTMKSQKDLDLLKNCTPDIEQRQSQIQEQVQNILEIIRHSFNYGGDAQKFNFNNSKTQGTKKQLHQKGDHQYQNTFVHSNRSYSIKKTNTQDGTFLSHNGVCLLFGKCGIGFEAFKEYQYYYPKYNYSYIIRAYRKLQQGNLKKNRGESVIGSPVVISNNSNPNNRFSFNKKKNNMKDSIKLLNFSN